LIAFAWIFCKLQSLRRISAHNNPFLSDSVPDGVLVCLVGIG
jgi:hypothetical protein